MNISVRRRNDTFIRMTAFRQEFPEDFPADSDETEQMDVIADVINLIAQHSVAQTSGAGSMRFEFTGKGTARENLREHLTDISTIAGTYAYTIPGIDLIFHVPKNLPDAAMIALARSFAEQAVPYQAQFVRRGLNGRFIQILQTAIADFETSMTPAEAAAESRVEATALIDEAVRRGMIARNILKGIMKIKYKTNPSRMRAWLSASHLEREGKTNADDKPPTV